MAVTEDASTPAVAHSTNGFTTATVVTASFTPPANSMLFVAANLGYASAWTTAPTLTPTAPGVTFTQIGFLADSNRKFLAQGVWYAFLAASPGAITVTITRTQLQAAGLQVTARVLTGTATTPGTIVFPGSANLTPVMSESITPSSLGSMIYTVNECDNQGTMAVVDANTTAIDTVNDTTDVVGLCVGRSTALTSSTGAQTYGFTTTAGTANAINSAVEFPPGSSSPKVPPAIPNPARICASNFL